MMHLSMFFQIWCSFLGPDHSLLRNPKVSLHSCKSDATLGDIHAQAYLFKPYVVLAGQNVQSVFALQLGLLNSLTRRVRVVAACATSLQHPYSP